MAIRSEWVRFGDESHTGMLAYPERAPTPLPAIVVVQEVWGVNNQIEDVTRRFAAAGYAAFAPDLLANGGERAAPLSRQRIAQAQAFMRELPPASWSDKKVQDEALAKRPDEERQHIRETLDALFASFNMDRHILVLLASTLYLRQQCPVTRGQKIGVVGFCMGGGLSALLACKDPELNAAVVFYGSSPPAELVPNIRCDVLGLYGSLDARITPSVPAFAEAMKTRGKAFESHVFEGAAHSFFNDDGPAYNVAASREAFARTLEFFRARLT